jgi:nucleoporin SEH1
VKSQWCIFLWYISLYPSTVLSSAGNDGRVRLWKATVGNVWRSAGSLGVEQAEETSPESEKRDVEMET